MKLTPLPLTVRAIIALGLPPSNGTSASTFIKSPTSCPSAVPTLHPKAFSFAARGSIARISSVLPVI